MSKPSFWEFSLRTAKFSKSQAILQLLLSCNTYSPMSALFTIVSQAPLGYIMVVYFDSIALFQQFLENFLIWSRFSTVKSTRIVYFMVSFLFALGFLYFSYFIQLTSKKAHCLLPQYILKISQVNINVTYGQGKLVRG